MFLSDGDSIIHRFCLHLSPKNPINGAGVDENERHADAGHDRYDRERLLGRGTVINIEAVIEIVPRNDQIGIHPDAEQEHQCNDREARVKEGFEFLN